MSDTIFYKNGKVTHAEGASYDDKPWEIALSVVLTVEPKTLLETQVISFFMSEVDKLGAQARSQAILVGFSKAQSGSLLEQTLNAEIEATTTVRSHSPNAQPSLT